MANELKMVFGSTTTVISHAATLTSGANTYTGMTGLTNTQLDNSTNLYPWARAVLGVPDTFAAAPTAGGTFDLYMIQDDIDGTSDETPEPSTADIIYIAKWVGAWTIDNQDVATIKPMVISLEGVQKARFFVVNNCGQQASYSSNPLTVKITPYSYMPT